MATLTVWRFPDPDGAEKALHTLEHLQRQDLIRVEDAAWVSWPEGRGGPATHQAHSLVGAGSIGGVFWGLLLGIIFAIPILGIAVGAAAGAATGALRDVGIDDDFIRRTRERVTPGSSALFALTSGADTDRVKEAFAGTELELIATNLSSEEEHRLRETFALED